MKKNVIIGVGLAAMFTLGYLTNYFLCDEKCNAVADKDQKQSSTKDVKQNKSTTMKLGAFSISLSVKDLGASKTYYENLGFTVLGGSMESNYLIMKNGNALIGLFQGMFEGNILTFNPGWDENGENIDDFNDIREIQKHMKKNGMALTMEADESTKGPASLMATDPDGNVILIDQHR